ncbi:MAG: hypothetical protein K0U41_08910 [Gammaproteobacteria bacterium]|nr:hypothetical protein [Gammaproteobacteria bacterium]
MRKPLSKTDLFLRLAKPDKLGFSRAVPVSEFKRNYLKLRLGNGGDWCRSDGTLGKRFNIRRNKQGNRIVSIQLQGFNKKPIGKHIPAAIHSVIVSQRCVVLDTSSNIECDHKDGRLDDPRLNDPTKVTLDDFQPLSKTANNAKRQHCKRCRQTDVRFDARKLGYPVSQVLADSQYNGTCVGCYWHDPKFFNEQLNK